VIEAETERIMKGSKCDWLDDLLTAVFISHTRILMSIGPNQNYNKINVTIPKTTTFIHKSYINIAREVWKNPYLFNEQVPGHEYQRNMKQLEDMIKLTIEDTIRRQLPIKEILKEHLETYDEPKQAANSPIDMQMIMNEIKKASLQPDKVPNELPEVDVTASDVPASDVPEVDVPEVDVPEVDVPATTVPEVEKNIPIIAEQIPIKSIFSREDDLEPIISVSPEPYTAPSAGSPYTDQGDPDEEQIRKATQGIVLNDITEPVVEERYDNSDIVVNNISTDNKEVTDKLNDMMRELDKLPMNDTTIKPISTDSTIKPISTDTKKLPGKITSVIKIDDPKVIVDKQLDTKQPVVIKSDTVQPGQPVQPFSFSNLYPNLSGVGNGKVEDISDKVTVGDTIKDINASTMKEIISIDKTEEKLDDTITLDNFFSDVKQMTKPMEPMKEETKYTLFEDAVDKDNN